jgi:hypothetical protein
MARLNGLLKQWELTFSRYEALMLLFYSPNASPKPLSWARLTRRCCGRADDARLSLIFWRVFGDLRVRIWLG